MTRKPLGIEEHQGRGRPRNSEEEELLRQRIADDRRAAFRLGLILLAVLAVVLIARLFLT